MKPLRYSAITNTGLPKISYSPASSTAEFRKQEIAAPEPHATEGPERILPKSKEERKDEIRERFANGETQKAIAKDYGICQMTVSRICKGVERKIAHIKNKQPIEGNGVKKIKELINERISKGETIEEIISKIKLNETEIKTLEVYVLPEERIALDEAAEKIGRKKITIAWAVKGIQCKLLGTTYRDILAEKYRKMSDAEIIEKIRETGAKSKSELMGINCPLHKASKEKGILDRTFPNKIIEGGRIELKNAFAKASKEADAKETLFSLTPFEREIMNAFAILGDESAIKEFAANHGMKTRKVVHAMERVARKLRGEKVIGHVLDEIKERFASLDQEKREELESRLNIRQRAIIMQRVVPEKPETLESIARSLGISRARVGQLEHKLLEKICAACGVEVNVLPKMTVSSPEIKERNERIREEYAQGKTAKEIAKDYGLNEGLIFFICKGVERKAGKKSGPRLKPQEKKSRDEEIQERYANGETVETIAKEFSLHPGYIYKICKNIRREAKAKRNLEIRKKYLDGESQASIAKEYGMTPQNVSTICKGVERRVIPKRGRRPKKR